MSAHTPAERRAVSGATRRLPAYGRDLLALRREDRVPARPIAIWLDPRNWRAPGACIGGEAAHFRLVVPDDMDPREIDFRPIAGLQVALRWDPARTSIFRRDDVIRAIFRSRPSWLLVFDLPDSARAFFVVSGAVGLERAEYGGHPG